MRLFTTREVSELVGKTPNTVTQYVKRGAASPLKPGVRGASSLFDRYDVAWIYCLTSPEGPAIRGRHSRPVFTIDAEGDTKVLGVIGGEKLSSCIIRFMDFMRKAVKAGSCWLIESHKSSGALYLSQRSISQIDAKEVWPKCEYDLADMSWEKRLEHAPARLILEHKTTTKKINLDMANGDRMVIEIKATLDTSRRKETS